MPGFRVDDQGLHESSIISLSKLSEACGEDLGVDASLHGRLPSSVPFAFTVHVVDSQSVSTSIYKAWMLFGEISSLPSLRLEYQQR